MSHHGKAKAKKNTRAQAKNKGKGKAPTVDTPVAAPPAIDIATRTPSSGSPSISPSSTPTSGFSGSWTSQVSTAPPKRARSDAVATSVEERAQAETYVEMMHDAEGRTGRMGK